MLATTLVNTNSMIAGGPTRLEDRGASVSPIVTETLYHDGYITNLSQAWGGHRTTTADSGFQIQGGAAESISRGYADGLADAETGANQGVGVACYHQSKLRSGLSLACCVIHAVLRNLKYSVWESPNSIIIRFLPL